MEHMENPEYISMNGRAGFLTKIIILCIIFSVLGIGSDLMENQLLKDIVDGKEVTEERANANDIRQGIIGLIEFVLIILFLVTFYRWVYRSYKNLFALGNEEPRFSAGWVVGYFFIPIINLYRPYQAFADLFNLSRAEGEQGDHTSSLLISWWTFWIISNYVSTIVVRVYWKAETPEEMLNANYAYLASYLFDIVSYVLTMNVIKKITSLQEAKRVSQPLTAEAIMP